MKTKRAIAGVAIVGVALMLLSLGATAYGAGGFRRGYGMRGGLSVLNHRLLRAVDITDEQKDQIREIKRAHRETYRTYRSDLRGIRQEMNAVLFNSGAVEEADLSPQIERIVEIRRKLTEEMIRVALKVRAVLTPEQLAKLAELSERLQALRTEARSLLQGSQ